MMRWVVGSSMQFRLLVVGVAGVILLLGIAQLRDTRVDLLPEFGQPYVEIQTEALGLSAAEVESLITTPLEADMLNGVPWMDEIRSESIPGLSSIVIVFKPGTNLLAARQVVQERLVAVHALPNVSKPPTMLNPLSSASRVMSVGLSSKKLSAVDMSVLARWTIKPRLMGIPGVANVSIWGQRDRQLQVLIDPEDLEENDVTLHQVISTTGNALWITPLSFLDASTPGTGGWIETPNQRLGVRHMLPITTAKELAEVTVDGTDLRLGDVADVVETHQPLIGDAIVGDTSNLMLVVEKFPWANTVTVTQDVEKALAALQHGVEGIEMDSTLYRPATFIETATTHLSQSLLLGGGLVLLALFAFFFNWRTALISIAAIALSLLATILVLHWTGTAMNLLVVTGIAMALVVIIDDAIMDVDQIAQRVRQPRADAGDPATASAVLDAAVQMRSALGYATAIVVLAVSPVFFMQGVYGAFFQAIIYPYVLAIVISTIVGLTVTTVLGLMLLGREPAGRAESPPARWLRSAFDATCAWIVRSPGPAFGFICVVLVAGVVLAPRLKWDSLLPKFKETDVAIHLDGLPGTSHPAMARIVTQMTKDLRTIPGVEQVSAHVGRAVMSDEVANINSTQLWVRIDPAANYKTTMAAIEDVVDNYPGLDSDTVTYSEERIQDALDHERDLVTVRVYGDDYKIMRHKADEVAAALAKVDGVVAPRVDYPEEEPALEIEVDLEKVKQYGLKPGDVRRTAAALLSGIHVGTLFDSQKVFDVVVWGKPEVRHSLTNVENLSIETASGERVKLAEVADIRFAAAETNIEREGVARYMDVTAQVTGRDYPTIAANIERGIDKIKFPLEYRAELLDGYAIRLAGKQRVAGVAIFAAACIFLLLQVSLGSWRLATAFFLTLPMALAGGALVLYAAGSAITLGALAGFLAILAIAIRNGMSLVKHYQHLEQHEGETLGVDLVLRGTRERFAPLVMSAVVMALALAPVAYFGSVAGLELVYPMALAALGSLVTATLFSLVGVPAMYLMFGKSPEAALIEDLQTSAEPAMHFGGPVIHST